MAYAASMLAWGEYEYKSALTSSGQLSYYENNLKFVLDYLASCWNGSTYSYQVGDGNNDHTWWGPVECIEKETQAGNRPVASSSQAGCVMAHTASALALGNILFGNATYLTKAQQLFTKVDTDRSDAGYTAANNFYTSWSGPIDELMWAACWLYIATNNSSYLEKAESYVPLLNLQQQTTEIEYQWGHCWDDVHYGAMLLLLRLTNNETYRHFIELHLDWWVAGARGKTPEGLSWLDSWGSLRYASASAFVAFVYSDWSGADSARATSYRNWAVSQLNYIAGDNERNASYIVGFGTNPPKHPHHRTAHGSWADSQQVPPDHRHTLYGALVGGPDQSGGYTDDIGNYTTNEVACDYNAGLAAAAIKMYALYGGNALSNFPQPETRDDELFCEAKAGGAQATLGSTWNPSNDPSYQDLTGTQAVTPFIPVYDGNTLIYGSEPGGGTPAPTALPTQPPTADPTTPTTPDPTAAVTPDPTSPPAGLLGDVNGSGVVDIVDALLVAQYFVGLNPSGFIAANADVNCSSSIDIVDALLIAQYFVGLITQFC